MICCAVPLLLIALFGFGGIALGAKTWVIIGGIAVMIVVHFLMMGRSHKHSDEENSINKEEDKDKSCH